jgi:hypothetical protein
MAEKRTRVSRTLMLTAALTGFVLLSLTTFAKGNGIWTSSSAGCPSSGYTEECTGNQVCGDWDVDGVTEATCCIEPQFLGSTLFEACN